MTCTYVFAARRRHGLSRRENFFVLAWAFFLIHLIGVSLGHSADEKNRQDGTKDSDEQLAAAKTAETIATAWNKNDHETIAGLFLPDAVLIMPTGSVVQSRPAIKKRLIDERNGKLKNTTLQNTIAGVSLPSSQAAVVKGRYQLRGMKILGFETSPVGTFVFHQRKHHGRWMISRAEILRHQAG